MALTDEQLDSLERIAGTSPALHATINSLLILDMIQEIRSFRTEEAIRLKQRINAEPEWALRAKVAAKGEAVFGLRKLSIIDLDKPLLTMTLFWGKKHPFIIVSGVSVDELKGNPKLQDAFETTASIFEEDR